MKSAILLGVFAIAICTPALAQGHHIRCDLKGLISKPNEKADSKRSMLFYLDDSAERLLPDDANDIFLRAQTSSYSDTRVDAELWDGPDDGRIFHTGDIVSGAAKIQINRVTGRITLLADVIPHGSIVEVGDCREAAPAITKF